MAGEADEEESEIVMTDTVQNELLPCPFCGGEPEVIYRSNPVSKWKYTVECKSTICGASGSVGESKKVASANWNTRTPAALPVGDEREAFNHEFRESVSEQVDEEKSGYWYSCSGCHESGEYGGNAPGYPFSDIFKCHLGAGCGECGGIGVRWDNTDYSTIFDEPEASRADTTQVIRKLEEEVKALRESASKLSKAAMKAHDFLSEAYSDSEFDQDGYLANIHADLYVESYALNKQIAALHPETKEK